MRKASTFCIMVLAFVLFFGIGSKVKAESYESEPNDTFELANALTNGIYTQGNLMTNSDVDYYKISIPQNGSMTISFKHGYVKNNSTWDYWNVYLYDANMNEYSDWVYTGNNMEEVTTAAMGVGAGVYYIKVNTNYNYYSDVFYQLKYSFTSSENWEKEFNDEYDKANDISLDTYINGNLRLRKDVDYYKISIPQNGSMTISFKHGYVKNNSTWDYWNVYLYDANMNEYSNWVYTGNNMEEVTTAAMGVGAGVYYIKVNTNNNYYSDVFYQLKYGFTSSENWEREFNDEYDKANDISLDTYTNGNLRLRKDVDYYKISIPQNGSMTISFKHGYVKNNSTWDYWNVYLYDANMNEYSNWVYTGNNMEEVTTAAMGVGAGVYYIKVNTNNNYYSDVYYQIMAKVAVAVSNISVQGNDSAIIGDSVQLTALVSPEGATNKDVTWSSSNTSIATVDNNGLVKCLSEGTVTIKADANDGSGISGTKQFTVKPKPVILVSGISVQGDKNGIVGEIIQLSATVTPQDAANKEVTWSSSDKSIASVDDFGLVECMSKGKVTITAKAKDGSGIVGSIKLTVKDDLEDEKQEEESSILKKVTIKKVTSKGKNVTVSWKKLNNSKKYEVQISTNKKFTKNLTKKTIKSNKQKITIKYKKKGTVYIRIRGIDKNGKVGKWSKVKKYTIKW